MTYAVLSLPDAKDLKTHGYDPEHPEHMESKAKAFAKARGLTPDEDFKMWQPLKNAEYNQASDDIRRRTVLYIDAHGKTEDESVGSTVQVPGSASDIGHRPYVHPDHLGLRESSAELVVVGVCFQRPESWEIAVPPGCVVIGYQEELEPQLYEHLYERFIDLRQLLKDDRAPAAHEMDIWLEHIVEWFKKLPDPPKPLPKSSDWFITVGKD